MQMCSAPTIRPPPAPPTCRAAPASSNCCCPSCPRISRRPPSWRWGCRPTRGCAACSWDVWGAQAWLRLARRWRPAGQLAGSCSPWSCYIAGAGAGQCFGLHGGGRDVGVRGERVSCARAAAIEHVGAHRQPQQMFRQGSAQCVPAPSRGRHTQTLTPCPMNDTRPPSALRAAAWTHQQPCTWRPACASSATSAA